MERTAKDQRVGLFGFTLYKFISSRYGHAAWHRVCEKACINPSKYKVSTDLIRPSFESEHEEVLAILQAVEPLCGVEGKAVQEEFGKYFFRFCVKKYGSIITAVAGNLYDFLNNLDDIYNHLKSNKEFEDLKSPSFFCSLADDGSLDLFYVFERTGYEHFAVGMLKEAALVLFKLNCSVKIHPPGRDKCTRFEIRERGKRLIKQQSLKFTSLSQSAEDSLIDATTMDKMLPFHIIINSEFDICQLGVTLRRLISPLIQTYGKRFSNYFDIVKPAVKLEFSDIIYHCNSSFVLQSKPADMLPGANGSLELKGQMTHLPDVDCLWFVGVPLIGDLEHLSGRGLYISDMPIHDATRNVILINEQANAQDSLKRKMQMMTSRLQDASAVLGKEKQKTQNLLDEIFPRSVSSRLMRGSSVPAVSVENITILFSDIVGFTAICGSCKPEDVIEMLNDLYIKFDALCVHHDLYKVETVGDAYMVAGGLHKKCKEHAQRVTLMGLGMIAAAGESNAPDSSKLKIRVGVHSGSVVAGVVGTRMPRYCLFGNNVTLANQMESSSESGRVHISPFTFALIKNCTEFRFHRRPREAMPAMMQDLTTDQSYFVYQRRPSSCGMWDTVSATPSLHINFMQSKRQITFLNPFGLSSPQSISAPSSRRPSSSDSECDK